MNNLLEIENLEIISKKENIKILKDINLILKKGEFLGIVGESGAGKTTLINTITAFLNEKNFLLSGKIKYFNNFFILNNEKIIKYNEKREFCKKHIGIIPQDSINSLNPYEKIKNQIIETYILHNNIKDKNKIISITKKILKEMGFENIDIILNSYPSQLSGGQRQRITIALSLCANINLLLADEPTTSLDAINQYKFVNFLKKICLEKNLTLIYISHDISLLSQICNRIIVMKNGEIVEDASSYDIFNYPKHEYTKLLIESVVL